MQFDSEIEVADNKTVHHNNLEKVLDILQKEAIANINRKRVQYDDYQTHLVDDLFRDYNEKMDMSGSDDYIVESASKMKHEMAKNAVVARVRKHFHSKRIPVEYNENMIYCMMFSIFLVKFSSGTGLSWMVKICHL